MGSHKILYIGFCSSLIPIHVCIIQQVKFGLRRVLSIWPFIWYLILLFSSVRYFICYLVLIFSNIWYSNWSSKWANYPTLNSELTVSIKNAMSDQRSVNGVFNANLKPIREELLPRFLTSGPHSVLLRHRSGAHWETIFENAYYC